MAERFVNAYQQAPWRTQLQWIGLFMLGIIVVVITAGLYLNITAQAAAAGDEIKNLEEQRISYSHTIAHQRGQLANLTSEKVMEKRALELGYERANFETAVYVVIPGYTGRQIKPLALPFDGNTNSSILLPAYQQSLWDWFFQTNLQNYNTVGK